MKENRKIIHIDMDAFYASIEQRDNPKYKGKPLIVGGDPNRRGVVATCSYEARKYGIHSAMPSLTAYKLCPKAIFIRPRMEVYKKVSRQVMNILNEYSNLVEPLSLDEAFVDVTKSKRCKGSATLMAIEIKERIFKELGLTSSAGVSFNKFLAKMASDFRKPDGITVITEENSKDFIRNLPIGKFFGVGRVTKNKLNNIGVFKGEDLLKFSEEELIDIFSDRGKILYEFARGIDNRPVNPYRIRKSIGKFLIKSFEFSSVITVIPSGFLKSDAIFAKNLLKETPAEAVRPTSLNILAFISRAIKVAEPLHLLLLLTSTKASSKDKGSTRLEYSFNIFITCLETFL